MGLAVLVTPLVWRGAFAAWGPPDRSVPSYLPALEPSRERAAFISEPIDELARMDPAWVIIGDSMAGRIDPDRLAALSGGLVAPLLQNATGSAGWYLALKNYVVASGVRPKWIFIFFRDTNLTEPLFRLDGAYRTHVDEVARDREDELNAVVAARLSRSWYRVHDVVDRLYATERVRGWVEPVLADWPARIIGGPGGEAQVLARVNTAFTLERLRVMSQADVAAVDARELDFHANVDSSLLPRMIAAAREHGLRIGFVRVLRRPDGGEPPPEPPALARYVADLAAYLQSQEAVFLDDRADPSLARLPYADGDHIAREARVPYTDRFWARVSRLTP
jgi:hypothetical protein